MDSEWWIDDSTDVGPVANGNEGGQDRLAYVIHHTSASTTDITEAMHKFVWEAMGLGGFNAAGINELAGGVARKLEDAQVEIRAAAIASGRAAFILPHVSRQGGKQLGIGLKPLKQTFDEINESLDSLTETQEILNRRNKGRGQVANHGPRPKSTFDHRGRRRF